MCESVDARNPTTGHQEDRKTSCQCCNIARSPTELNLLTNTTTSYPCLVLLPLLLTVSTRIDYVSGLRDNSSLFNPYMRFARQHMLDTSATLTISFSVNEDIPIGTQLGRLHDLIDPPPAEEVQFTMPTNPYFSVKPSDGTMHVIGSLDRDIDRQLCTEPGHPHQCVWTSFAVSTQSQYYAVRITVSDVNDNVPGWPQPSITIPVREEQSTKAPTELPTATDPDLGKHGIVDYKLKIETPNAVELFRLQVVRSTPKRNALSSGETNEAFQLFLHFLKPLDRETQSTYEFTLLVFDGSEPYHTGSLHITVQVLDENDHTPRFSCTLYAATIEEDAMVGSEVLLRGANDTDRRQADSGPPSSNDDVYVMEPRPRRRLEATDRDIAANGEVEYTFSAATHPSVFKSFQLDKQTGTIRIASPLSYDIGPKEWQFQVVATDHGRPARSSSTNVHIRLTDSNTHAPEIRASIRRPKVYADRLERAKIDRIFDRLESNVIYIPENSPPISEPLAVLTVGDKDTGPGGLFDCLLVEDQKSRTNSLTDHVLTSYFHLNFTAKLPNWKVYSLFVHGAIDRERIKSNHLSVQCVDQGQPIRSSTHQLQIVIIDENDNSPRFAKSHFRIHVLEGALPNTTVGKITATDPDDGENARLTYHLVWPPPTSTSTPTSTPSQNETIFRVTQDGRLIVVGQLDREKDPNGFRFKVIATDNGSVQRHSATADVDLLLDDVNDCTPKFTSAHYNFSIVEDYGKNFTSERWVGEVLATDCDLGLNGAVTYSILDPGLPFEVTNGGIVKTTRLLDRELRPIYRFTVLARDGGMERIRMASTGSNLVSPTSVGGRRGQIIRSSAARVYITVTDLNDHRPLFVYPNASTHPIRISVYETPGFVVTRMVAVDKDTGMNGKIEYGITRATLPDYFNIRANTGEVFIERKLDSKSNLKENVILTIQATDRGIPSQTSSIDLRIILTDSSPMGQSIIPSGLHSNQLQSFTTSTSSNRFGTIELNKLIVMCIVISTSIVCCILIFAIAIFVRRTSCYRLTRSNRRTSGLDRSTGSQGQDFNMPWQLEPEKVRNGGQSPPDMDSRKTLSVANEVTQPLLAPTVSFACSTGVSFTSADKIPGIMDPNLVAQLLEGLPTISNKYVHQSNMGTLTSRSLATSNCDTSLLTCHLERNHTAQEVVDGLMARLITTNSHTTMDPLSEHLNVDVERDERHQGTCQSPHYPLDVCSIHGSTASTSAPSGVKLLTLPLCNPITSLPYELYSDIATATQSRRQPEGSCFDSDVDSGRGGSVNNCGHSRADVEPIPKNQNTLTLQQYAYTGDGPTATNLLPLHYLPHGLSLIPTADGQLKVLTNPMSTDLFSSNATTTVLVPMTESYDGTIKPASTSGTTTVTFHPVAPSLVRGNQLNDAETQVGKSIKHGGDVNGGGMRTLSRKETGPWRLSEIPSRATD